MARQSPKCYLPSNVTTLSHVSKPSCICFERKGFVAGRNPGEAAERGVRDEKEDKARAEHLRALFNNPDRRCWRSVSMPND